MFFRNVVRWALIAAATSASLMAMNPANAAEDGKGIYLLGLNTSMAGALPPPGVYFTSASYFYHGTAGNSVTLPEGGRLVSNIDAQMALEMPIGMWVLPQEVLGGHVGLGVIAPFGYLDVSAKAEFTTPGGIPLAGGVGDSAFTFGDPVLMATLGWSKGTTFWRVYSLLNIPIGDYKKGRLSNIAFHRWAGDVGAAATWLDPATGIELSSTVGFTFNGENPSTNYTTGTEFHAEVAALKHMGQTFAFGLTAYHYQQITGDSGSGAVLGSFEGRTTGVGAIVTTNTLIGTTPLSINAHVMQEFGVKNRLTATVGFLTVAFPL